ncbi:MAG: sigma-70 family RNA polymerase sigma factor [Planctomycetes bacterium]|nr:sigma-70 family RNA polymerase sigma factor [Planctomycetota bacterium]MBI3833398.1 sigma-70 family RNA polymerase sigma factor [Planctomycetota bacterium]
MSVAEESLTTAALAGDREALGELLVRCDGNLRNRIADGIPRAYRPALDVADVLQVTYLEAFLRIGQFQPNGNGSFIAWLTTSAENNLRDALRALDRDKRPPRRKQVASSLSDDSYVVLLASLAESASTPSHCVSCDEAKQALESAIGKLPPDYERVVRLSDLQGLSAADVAQQMQRSVPAVYMLKARAHEHLVTLLGRGSQFFSGGFQTG